MAVHGLTNCALHGPTAAAGLLQKLNRRLFHCFRCFTMATLDEVEETRCAADALLGMRKEKRGKRKVDWDGKKNKFRTIIVIIHHNQNLRRYH